jgi:translation elongation factor EF-1alpha
MKADNLLEKSKSLDWYKGKCLIDLIDSLEIPIRETKKPPRMTITNIY